MKVYFVRHGTTDSLKQKISQPDDEPLNEKGKLQAKALAKRFENVDLDMVISSTLARAVETAESLGRKVTKCELFKEVKKPKEVVGRSKEDVEVKEILNIIGQHYYSDPNWHYSDEENFVDLRNRAIEAVNYLKSLNKENVLVVSHGNFVALMMGVMMYGEEFPVELALKMKNFFRLSATGVSICIFEEGRWKLQSWNDANHCPKFE